MKALPTSVAAVAFLIVLVAGVYKLTESPAIWYDEGLYMQTAMNLAGHGREALQIAPGTLISASGITVGFPLLAPVAFSFLMFGTSVLAARAVMVLFLLALALAGYVLIRRLTTPLIASLSLLLLVSSPLLYGNGKSVLGEVPGVFFFLLSLLAVHALERSQFRSKGAWVLAGMFAGLSFATKPVFALGAIALTLTYLILLFARKAHFDLQGLLLGIAGFLAPALVWIATQFGPGDSVASVLGFYSNPYEASNVGLLVLQNLLRFVTEFQPVYTLLAVLVWGAWLALRARRALPPAAELSAFAFCVLILVAYTRLDGWYRYLFPAEVIAFLFIPPSLAGLYAALSRRVSLLTKFSWAPFAAIALLALVQLSQVAHGSYVASYYGSHRTRDLQEALAQLPEGATLFFYDVPELVVFSDTHPYYQYVEPHPKQHFGTGSLEAGEAAYVITSTSMYERRPEAFTAYKKEGTVNRYTFLSAL